MLVVVADEVGGDASATVVATIVVVVVVVVIVDAGVVVVVVTAVESGVPDVESLAHAAHTHNTNVVTTLRITVTVPPDYDPDQASRR